MDLDPALLKISITIQKIMNLCHINWKHIHGGHVPSELHACYTLLYFIGTINRNFY